MEPVQFDPNKSLQVLENADWGEASYASHLVRTCHRLRRVPLREFSIEDMRLMIRQSIGLPFLMPMALERLADEPFAEGDFYPGDLLAATLRVEEQFWRQHPDLRKGLSTISKRALSELGGWVGREAIKRHLSEAHEVVQRRSSPR